MQWTRRGSADTYGLAVALRRAGLSDVDSAARRRAEYSSDASNYRVVPTAVAFPRHTDEVEAAVSVCRDLGVPLTARGAGTSIAGNALGAGLILDFSRNMNRVLDIDPEARTARVEPGAVLDSITASAGRHGLRFGPDPSTHSRASIGGSIGNNACGSRALAYGRTADNITRIDLLTASGERIDATTLAGQSSARLVELSQLVDQRLAVIRTEFGRFRRQVSGYSLEHLLPENGRNLARFLVGTEGTLGITVGATVRLVEQPPFVALAVLGYADLPAAAEAVPALLPHRPVALEAIDARLVQVVRDGRGPAAVPDLPAGGGWIFAEVSGADEAEAQAAAASLIRDACALDSAIVTGPAARTLWHIREDGVGLGGRTPAGQPAWPGWEDAAVPPEHLADYLREFTGLLREHGLDSLLYGHFGDGCVHARIDFPLATRPEVLRRFVAASAELVRQYGGSMSGEHGDGRARSELLPLMYSAAAIETFAAVKHLFDPEDLLNPGVIVRPAPIDADLRVPAARPVRHRLGFAYSYDGGDLSTAVHRCVGVGKCRADTTANGGVMCPSYLATRDEKDSTRGRARVLQELANGSLVKGFAADEVRESLDLCLSCKGCSSDCPAGVDMATYKSEVLHQRYRRRLRPPSHYALGWLPRWARLAAHAPRLVNGALSRKAVAALAKWAGGIDARRPLPRFADLTFRAWFAKRPPRTDGPQVLLFVDTFTDYFSPEVGQAAVAVLESAGYAVQVSARSVCCGLTWISTGQLDGARGQLRKTLNTLEPSVSQGIPVIGLEPSCTAVLRSDLRELLPDDARASAVAGATVTLAELLQSTPSWQPPSLAGIAGIAQPHCHQHAVLGWQADADLMAAAGASITSVGGCCGLAGNFGFERGHYDVSVEVANTALLPAVASRGKGSVVLADGFSCRTQLDQLAGVRGLHVAQLLAEHLERP